MLELTIDGFLEFEEACGSCTKFEQDFDDRGRLYGHCGVKPRSASIIASDFKCPNYQIVPMLREHLGLPERPKVDRSVIPNYGSTRSTRRTRHVSTVRRKRKDATEVLRLDRQPLEGFDDMDRGTFKEVVAELLDEMVGISDIEIGERWQGGTLVLQPENSELQAKVIPLETFFKKVVMVRERLRVLEQKINNHKTLLATEKVDLQQYITRCYGSLTTFNALFRDKADYFRGDKKS